MLKKLDNFSDSAPEDSLPEKHEVSSTQNKLDLNSVSDESSSVTEVKISDDEDSEDECIVIQSDGENDDAKIERLKSNSTYVNRYADFNAWKENMKIEATTEKSVIDYLEDMSRKYIPSTLKSIHSILKTMLLVKEKINIENFSDLNEFMKKKTEGFKGTTKSGILSVDNIRDFLNNAPNNKWLASKVNTIYSVYKTI